MHADSNEIETPHEKATSIMVWSPKKLVRKKKDLETLLTAHPRENEKARCPLNEQGGEKGKQTMTGKKEERLPILEMPN